MLIVEFVKGIIWYVIFCFGEMGCFENDIVMRFEFEVFFIIDNSFFKYQFGYYLYFVGQFYDYFFESCVGFVVVVIGKVFIFVMLFFCFMDVMVVIRYGKDIFFVVYCYELFWVIISVNILFDIFFLVYDEVCVVFSDLVRIFIVFQCQVDIVVFFLCYLNFGVEIQLNFVLEFDFFRWIKLWFCY